MHPADDNALVTEEKIWDLTQNINVKGVWYGCKHAIIAMRQVSHDFPRFCVCLLQAMNMKKEANIRNALAEPDRRIEGTASRRERDQYRFLRRQDGSRDASTGLYVRCSIPSRPISQVLMTSMTLVDTTSKGAVLAMTRELAMIHAREGIRFNSLCPSVTCLLDRLSIFFNSNLLVFMRYNTSSSPFIKPVVARSRPRS
jgi:NAD(P)-dependent dehydrogenase (short-subunit alcohol dehydrogenase family)